MDWEERVRDIVDRHTFSTREDVDRAEKVAREAIKVVLEEAADVAFESFGTCGECVSNIGHAIRALGEGL